MSPRRFRDSKLVQHEGRMMLEGSISVSTRRPCLSVLCRSLFLAVGWLTDIWRFSMCLRIILYSVQLQQQQHSSPQKWRLMCVGLIIETDPPWYHASTHHKTNRCQMTRSIRPLPLTGRQITHLQAPQILEFEFICRMHPQGVADVREARSDHIHTQCSDSYLVRAAWKMWLDTQTGFQPLSLTARYSGAGTCRIDGWMNF